MSTDTVPSDFKDYYFFKENYDINVKNMMQCDMINLKITLLLNDKNTT